MNIQVEPILLEQKSVFSQLLNLSNYDYTEYTNNDISEDGYFHDDDTDYFLTTDNLHSFFIRVDKKLAGFVIVDCAYVYFDDEDAHNIDEFFIMKKYRRNGVGTFAAKAAFDMFRGKWEVCQMQNNMPARKFWKSVISEYTKDDYQECGTENDEMVGFIFDSSHTK